MPNPQQFERDLGEIPLLFENLLDFEKVLSKRLKIDPDQFKRSGSYLFLRAGFIDRWKVLNKFKNYPGMLPPLSMPIRAKS